jgi:hypothetical protein
VGGVLWGARIAEFDTFHFFFAGIAVFATPVAAVGIWNLWLYLRAMGRRQLAIITLIICVAQVELGIAPVMIRLEGFGPKGTASVPLDVLAAIRALPADAKLAYACGPDEEYGYFGPGLAGIYAHTDRRVVPMCYESDVLSRLIGADPSIQAESAIFTFAPQHVLYPDATSTPSSASILAFLKDHDIGYIYADAEHSNSLVPDAIPIASHGDVAIFQIPP